VTLYEDDGLTPAYKTGAYRRTKVNVESRAGAYVVHVGTPEGTYNSGARKFNYVVKSASGSPRVVVDGP
jgi:hypothetical protein